MLADLANKVAVVTGAASGIGAACTRLFARSGARVLLADIDRAGGEALAAELNGGAGAGTGASASAHFVPCDVTREGDVMGAVHEAARRWGRLDVMVNNCGMAGRQGRAGLIENADEEDFVRVMQVNARGALFGMKHAARAMKARHSRGVIINMASIAGLRVQLTTMGPPVYMPASYVASKHALVGLTKSGACELAPYGIRVNAVAPGVTATPLVGRFLTGKQNPTQQEVEAALVEQSVLHGVALLPEDVANSVAFLASDMARCINGHTLVVDLGLTVGVSGELTLVKGTVT